MSRPRKEKSPNINIRTRSLAEHEAYYLKAEEAGLKLPAYIRLKCLGIEPLPSERTPTRKEKLQAKLIAEVQQFNAYLKLYGMDDEFREYLRGILKAGQP